MPFFDDTTKVGPRRPTEKSVRLPLPPRRDIVALRFRWKNRKMLYAEKNAFGVRVTLTKQGKKKRDSYWTCTISFGGKVFTARGKSRQAALHTAWNSSGCHAERRERGIPHSLDWGNLGEKYSRFPVYNVPPPPPTKPDMHKTGENVEKPAQREIQYGDPSPYFRGSPPKEQVRRKAGDYGRPHTPDGEPPAVRNRGVKYRSDEAEHQTEPREGGVKLLDAK